MKKKFFSAALAAAMVVTSVFSTTSVAGAAENETAVPYGNVTVKQEGNNRKRCHQKNIFNSGQKIVYD